MSRSYLLLARLPVRVGRGFADKANLWGVFLPALLLLQVKREKQKVGCKSFYLKFSHLACFINHLTLNRGRLSKKDAENMDRIFLSLFCSFSI